MSGGLARAAEVLQRRLGLEQLEALAGVGDTIIPVAIVLPYEDDLLFLRGERRLSCWNTVAGGLALRSCVALLNPSGSNVLARVDYAMFITDGVVNAEPLVRIMSDFSTGASVGYTGRARDSRAAVESTCIPYTNNTRTLAQLANTGSTLEVMETIALNATNPYTVSVMRRPLIIHPGGHVEFISGGDNQGVGVTISWIERPIEATER